MLFAFPYVVQVVKYAPCREPKYIESGSEFVVTMDADAFHCGKTDHVLKLDPDGMNYFCSGSAARCEWVYDLAESMNDAHRKRMSKTPDMGAGMHPPRDK